MDGRGKGRVELMIFSNTHLGGIVDPGIAETYTIERLRGGKLCGDTTATLGYRGPFEAG